MELYVYCNETEREKRGVHTEELQAYIAKNFKSSPQWIRDDKPLNIFWEERPIGALLLEKVKAGDVIVVFDAIHLARSTSQFLEILQLVSKNEVVLHFVKYNRVFLGRPTCLTVDLLSLMKDVESDFVSRRTTDALARRRAQGLPLGRPKGRKNKALKLDKFYDEILRYLELNISKASIAKLVRCHPQTLYDWLDRKGIFDAKGNIQPKHLAKIKEKELV